MNATATQRNTQWRENSRERREAGEKFKRELIEAVGPSPSVATRALIETATVAYVAIVAARRNFECGRAPERSILALARLQGALNRSLKHLGLAPLPRRAREPETDASEGDLSHLSSYIGRRERPTGEAS